MGWEEDAVRGHLAAAVVRCTHRHEVASPGIDAVDLWSWKVTAAAVRSL